MYSIAFKNKSAGECWNTALTRAVVEVIFQYMRACKLPKSGVDIFVFQQGHIYTEYSKPVANKQQLNK